jgi:dipeptidyl aminopeptidase/acylaminoacyl peptidase
MQTDIRETALYREAEAMFNALRRPGAGQVTDATEINAAPDGQRAIFSGTLIDKLEGSPPTRLCDVDLTSGEVRVLTSGPNTDRLPKYSPDGCQIAFLSDRHREGDFQLHLLDPHTGSVHAAASVAGWVEYLHWSPDGRRILLAVAGHGADVAGGQGAVASKRIAGDLPSWIPQVETGDESYRWRTLWVYELDTDRAHQVRSEGLNIWEAVWCGHGAIAAVVSAGPSEGLWYSAHLVLLELPEPGLPLPSTREIYKPQDQLGWPAGSPSGSHLAIVEAVCSDRWIVAGELRLINVRSGSVSRIDTHNIDITYTEWRSDQQLLVAGHRGFETAVGLYDVVSETFAEVWSSAATTTGGRYSSVSGIGQSGDCVLVGESFLRAPEIALIRRSRYNIVKSLGVASSDSSSTGLGSRAAHSNFQSSDEEGEPFTWNAPDGLEIQGWLLRPPGKGPHPLVLAVHGGPVWHWRPVWLGRNGLHWLTLLRQGYAVLFPNPRGSAGRGLEFARRVKGDLNGADTLDLLSGLDNLVRLGIADPARLGVMGGSYGGNMTAWLITQDTRFAAAVTLAPHTNQVTEHLLSNIPHFVSLFLADSYTNLSGRYYQRSPVVHAHKVRTPTLNVCGALDRCTPPEEAVQFHNALLENGVRSVLVTYPEEGHGIRRLPTVIDFAARVAAWFGEHMPVRLPSL